MSSIDNKHKEAMSFVRAIIDRATDYIPLVSTLANLIDIFEKFAFQDKELANSKFKNHYYEYLEKKSYARCALLLLPILGNIAIYFINEREARQARLEQIFKKVSHENLQNTFKNLPSKKLKNEMNLINEEDHLDSLISKINQDEDFFLTILNPMNR